MARGYAVLLPDPALSTGYGQHHIQRGWGAWGKAPFTDLMAITDAVVQRPDIDETRTARMGGSFGGYMANWVAGHTDRFKAVVTHASLWGLDPGAPPRTLRRLALREMTAQMALENSPHLHVGEHQHPHARHPRRQGLPRPRSARACASGTSCSPGPGWPPTTNGDTEHRFLYFPDENHWILQPQHAKVWYGVVEHFLARNLLDKDLPVPAELGL